MGTLRLGRRRSLLKPPADRVERAPEAQGGSRPWRGRTSATSFFLCSPRQATPDGRFPAESWAWTERVPGHPLCLHSDDPRASLGTRTPLFQLRSTDRSVGRRPDSLGSVISREPAATRSSSAAQFPLMRAEVVPRGGGGDGPAPVGLPAWERRGMQIRVGPLATVPSGYKNSLKNVGN